MSRIRTVVVVAALSLFCAVVVAGLVVALVGRVPLAPTVSVANPPSAASADRVAVANPNAADRPATTPPDAPQAPVPPGDESSDLGADGGTGPSDGGLTIPPMPAVTFPPLGAPAQITWLSAWPSPAACGGSFTIFADVWDDVGVVSAMAYVNGVGYPMSTGNGTSWYVLVPVPAGAELNGWVGFSVDIRDTDEMGMWSSSNVSVTC